MFAKENKIVGESQIQSFPAIQKLNSFVAMLLRKWWLFAIVGVLAGIGGIFYASQQKTLYKSRLTFALDEAGSNSMGGFMSIASQFGITMGNGKDIFEGDNITEIMKSRRMIQKVLLSADTFDNKPYTLIEYYLQKIKNNGKENPNNQLHFPVNQADSSFSYQQDSLLYSTYLEFSKKITAERPDRKLSIYEVNVTTPDEKFTKDFTERLVNATNNFYVEIRTRKAKETLDILEQRVSSMKGNLNSSISSKAAVQDVNINPAFSEAEVPVQKQQANIQVYGAAYSEMFKNLELARFQYLNEIPLMQIIDNANYPMQKIKAGKLKTGIIWAVVSCLLIVFIFWIIRIIHYPADNKFQA
jgi:uncharacterized protein involved in exopolysaccharide biosynthesis